MNELIPKFRDSALKPAKSLMADTLEMGIDAILEEGLLREIPIFKTLLSIKNVYVSIRDRYFLKQTFVFIQELSSQKLTDEQLEKYRSELETDPIRAEKELGRVMVLLERMIEDSKSKMLADLYSACIRKELSWMNSRIYQI